MNIYNHRNSHTELIAFGLAPFSKSVRHISLISCATSQALRNTGFPSQLELLTSAPCSRAINAQR